MGTKSAQCLSLLEDCLALQLHRDGGPPPRTHREAQQYWIYDSGYLIYQGFVEANLKCCWDRGLISAVRGLQFRGYISPGILLVGGSPPALHLLRAAWARRVLKPPPNYQIALLGDVEDCTVSKVRQTSFTPLPDAVCWVILQLSAAGQNAVLDSIQSSLSSTFPEMEQPSRHILYDTLADLMTESKIYQTAQGYFVSSNENGRPPQGDNSGRQVLLTHAEAAALASGEIVTIREGAKTHQAIQTNLADIICGGNKSDKILYARAPTRTPGRKLERRHSMRLLGSSRRLAALHRAGSVRLLHSSPGTENNQKKCSLFSKLFKWSKRQSPAPNGIASALAMSFPPQEWFNSTVLGLHSVGTQTKTMGRGEGSSMQRGGEWSECGSLRSRRRSLSTSRLPRRQTRPPSVSPSRPSTSSTPTSSKTVLTPKALSSASSGYNSLPRPHKSKSKIPQSNSPSTRHTSNSIKVELSASPSITTDTKVDTHMSASINDPSATMTTTINGPNSTKIYVQQQNSPIRSVITFEKSRKTDKIKEESERNERNSKVDLKRTRRPSSLYQQRERDTSKENVSKNNVNVEKLGDNLKMKFPSSETIQMEEKLIVSGNKNIKNECPKKNLFETSNIALKAGSLVDVADCSVIDGQMNNVRKASASLIPLQPALSSDKVLESLSYKNVLKEKEDKNNCYSSNNKLQTFEKTIEVATKKVESKICSFPSLSDLSLHFTSIAAQNILNGVSINSLDTLVENNEKHNLKDMSIHTDMGVV